MSIYDHLEFRHLRYIVAIAEAGTFTAAALRIPVAQSLSAVRSERSRKSSASKSSSEIAEDQPSRPLENRSSNSPDRCSKHG